MKIRPDIVVFLNLVLAIIGIVALVKVVGTLGEVRDTLVQIQARETPTSMSEPIILTFGNSSIPGRPFTAEWDSGSETIKVLVYKNSTTETESEWVARFTAAITESVEQYPKNGA